MNTTSEDVINIIKRTDEGTCPYDMCWSLYVGVDCRDCLIDYIRKSLIKLEEQ